MITLLQSALKYENTPENIYCPEAMIRFCDSILNNSSADSDLLKAKYNKANALLQLGEEQKAIDIYEELLNKTSKGDFEQRRQIMKDLAVAYLRLGERMNCIHNHNAESCIYPIANGGVHHG